ncbi:beta-1,6-galactofuranosyltransferase [Lactococcus hodotermopsidis]|uniref:Beta-1,6-galactofuranosyltransferase n=1 Tax=Pseudolactococcus hodotermopsidis TaxID=2709157 RepID=A0A6A0BDX3_9LACT|nr:hypothetical protein [Lactococcus hodotermopsidis]GFH43006.1 beta-1,6-galactofuranosyltransferase [Lactococcus hodotermopsidis]
MKWVTQTVGRVPRADYRKAQEDFAHFAKAAKFRRLAIFRFNDAQESDEELQRRIWGIIAGLKHGDLLIHQYPTWNSKRYEDMFQREASYKGVTMGAYIQQLPALSNERFEADFPLEILFRYDFLIAHTEKMREKLQELGYEKLIFVSSFADYVQDYPIRPKKFLRQVVYFGDIGMKPKFLSWSNTTMLKVLGPNHSELSKSDSVKFGANPNLSVVSTYLEGGFGFLERDSRKTDDYAAMSFHDKLSLFLSAGMPVIVYDDFAYAEFIVENKLGFAISQISEIDEKIAQIDEENYAEFLKNVSYFGELMRTGFFTGKLLQQLEGLDFFDLVEGRPQLGF